MDYLVIIYNLIFYKRNNYFTIYIVKVKVEGIVKDIVTVCQIVEGI